MTEYAGNNQNRRNSYVVDLVICIDGTGSMRNIIDRVKSTAQQFYQLYANAMLNSEPPRPIRDNGFRVKVIVFRDFADTATKPLEQSDFYDLQNPDEVTAFKRYVDGIEAIGGGNIPENALEAIATALKTKWQTVGGNWRRQAILLFTDTCTYDLHDKDRETSPLYPAGMPDNIEALQDIWENGDQELAPYYVPRLGRLIVFAPLDSGYTASVNADSGRTIEWKTITSWQRIWLVEVQPDGGCDQVDIEQALTVLVNSY